MGVVYKAYDLATKRHVALKSMRGRLSPAALELFSKEWSVLAHLSHPNIVEVLISGSSSRITERKPFFVMPLLPGVTLDQLIRVPAPADGGTDGGDCLHRRAGDCRRPMSTA